MPLTETDTINFGGRFEHTKLTLFSNSPPLYVDFVRQFGDVTNTFILTAGWARDTRDSVLFPTRGLLQSAFGEVGLPTGSLEYYKANYLIQWFTPLPLSSVLMLRSEFGYGGGLSNKTLPFFKAYYGGGVGSVRGFETASLGPQDSQGNTIGGRRKVVANAEVFFPMPGTKPGDQSVRLSVFADAGQIHDAGFQPHFVRGDAGLEDLRDPDGVRDDEPEQDRPEDVLDVRQGEVEDLPVVARRPVEVQLWYSDQQEGRRQGAAFAVSGWYRILASPSGFDHPRHSRRRRFEGA